MSQRKSTPTDIRVLVLTQAGYRCAVPTCRTILALDLHHIVELSAGGSDDPHNLVALCPTCHALYHRGTIKLESIRAWKILLFSISEVLGKRAIDDLILLELQVGDILFKFSGDILVHYGQLLASGLVEFDEIHMPTANGSEFRYYSLNLTEKGRLFLEAYRNGHMSEAQKLVSIMTN